MKKFLVIYILILTCSFGQCLSSPASTRVGAKLGLNYSSFKPSDGTGEFNGLGMHIGFAMGADLMDLIALDLAPQFRTTSFRRTDQTLIGDITTSVSFSNFYLPAIIALKAGRMQPIAPYIGIGVAGNFQMSGKIRIESDGSAIEDELDDLENDVFVIFALGTEIKATQMRISPELSVNYNLTPDFPDPDNPNQQDPGDNIDFHFSLGFFYSP